jgi:hypothetical protein
LKKSLVEKRGFFVLSFNSSLLSCSRIREISAEILKSQKDAEEG